MNYSSKRLLDMAHGVALARMAAGHRQPFRFGCVGLRVDGKLVSSFNASAIWQAEWKHHAESRLCRKLTVDSIVAVVRIGIDGNWLMARPCDNCQTCMKRIGVKKVFYSIGPDEFGIMNLEG